MARRELVRSWWLGRETQFREDSFVWFPLVE
jgi:hypothetical protein